MDSISKVLKDTIVQSMEDDIVYSNSQLKKNIYQKAGMQYGIDYKESHFAGCLTALRNKKLIEQVERGKHRKINAAASSKFPLSGAENAISCPPMDKKILIDDAKEKILLSIQQEIHYINDITENIFLDFHTADKEYHNIQEIKKLIQFLQDFTFV